MALNDPENGSQAAPPSFEEALERLEQIVRELEGKDLSLEETLARYEEGSRLVRVCGRRLEEAEQRLKVLAEEDDAAGADADAAGEVREHGDDEAAGENDLPF
ncbi:MAG: exodeoxyribonuclease VII small subunit [Candidatus Eisenbacteria bacterium]